MNESIEKITFPDEVVLNKLYVIRNMKVMINRDLADHYGVEEKRLKEAVRMNISRFPEDFMFEMKMDELTIWRSQIATSNLGYSII